MDITIPITTIKDWVQVIFQVVMLAATVVTAWLTMRKWNEQIRQRRAEKVSELRSRMYETFTVVFIIDWELGVEYDKDGAFHLTEAARRKYPTELKDITDEAFGMMIDKMLMTLSQICYLRLEGSLNSEDMKYFDYEIRSVTDYKPIADYLHSITLHARNLLHVECPYFHLIKYCIKRKFLDKSILSKDCTMYENHLTKWESQQSAVSCASNSDQTSGKNTTASDKEIGQ